MARTAWKLAVVGAGPVGLATALHAAHLLPHAQISLFDARQALSDVSGDPRTLALAQGSVQFLQRLGAWPAAAAEPILEVRVSQTPPGPRLPWGEAELCLSAQALGVAQLGAVLSYGALLVPLQRAWDELARQQPLRLHTRFGAPVAAVKTVPGGVEVDAAIAETFDLAVLAEGSVALPEAASSDPGLVLRRPLIADYQQTAWVGTVTLRGARRGLAIERFTRHGPLALLPLPPPPEQAALANSESRAALVWCVPSADDPVRELDAPQRLTVLRTLLPEQSGRLVGLSALKSFPLALRAERSLVDGRTVRIGNAAQTLHPVAGQGLNLGLRDAHELVSVLRWTDDLDAALRRAEWARAADRWSMIAATDFLARSFTWVLPGAATARGLGLAALQALPPLQHWLARRMMFGRR